MNFADTLLFTGAGFTANFDGFLGREMWSRIFNNPKLNTAGNIKLKLKEEFDFENIYSEVFDHRGNIPAEELAIFGEVINDTYKSMDKVIKGHWDDLNINHNKFKELLDHFKEQEDNRIGACFTLNQDLLMEQRFNWQPLGPDKMRYREKGSGLLDSNDLDSDEPKTLPTMEELKNYKENLVYPNFCYVKLHGSLRWVGPSGQNSMIIGVNKREAILKIPLLEWYSQLFDIAISKGNVKLVIIGYGFRKGEYINTLLSKASNEKGLKIFIISTEDPEDFKFRITHKQPRNVVLNEMDDEGIAIWDAVQGYFQYKLTDIFKRRESSLFPEVDEIYRSLGV